MGHLQKLCVTHSVTLTVTHCVTHSVTHMKNFFSPISLKIKSVVVQYKKIVSIFDFSDFAQKVWKKSDSSLKFGKKFTKDFNVQFFSMRILCKLNPDEI